MKIYIQFNKFIRQKINETENIEHDNEIPKERYISPEINTENCSWTKIKIIM